MTSSNKTAIQYIRISDKDQSHFSLDGQQETNQRYAARMGIDIIRTYIDNGESARDFDRPNWKKLMKDLEANKARIDFLIVMKYDRLIRNAAQGLMALEKIEMRWNIKVLSSTEQISIDPNSPFFFKFRADMLVNAEFERMVISERSRFGVWRAKSEGRFIGTAPFGYINARDANNKPIIVLDSEEKQETIREAFRMFLEGKSLSNISAHSRSKGFELRGHSAITRMLVNPVYAGLIEVPAFKDELPKTIKAKHQSIISEYEHSRAVEIIKGPAKKHSTLHPEVYLRGLVTCQHCGAKHTASRVKGKLKYYWYYHCNTCRKDNINANKAHQLLSSILESISLSDIEVAFIKDTVQKKIENYLKSSQSKQGKLLNQKTDVITKLENLEEKFIMSQVDSETYNRWASKLKKELHTIEYEIGRLQSGALVYWKAFDAVIPKLSDLNYIFDKANVSQKQDILKYLFSDQLTLTKNEYRTPFVSSLLQSKALNISGLNITKKGETDSDLSISPISAPDGTILEHPFDIDYQISFFKLLNKIA